jgi:hypothetical protein
MNPAKRSMAGGRCLAVALALGLSAGSAAALAETGVRLELNRLEPQGDSCRAYLVIENGTGEPYKSLKLDLFAFDTDGVIAKRLALEAGPLPARKTGVKLFDFTGLSCERFSRVLLNDVVSCETAGGVRTDCLAAIATASKTGRVTFDK